jgi:hypothetical protein
MCTDNGVRHQIALPEARLQGREAIAGAAQGLIDVVPNEVVEIGRVTEGATAPWSSSGSSRARTRTTRPGGRRRARRSTSSA